MCSRLHLLKVILDLMWKTVEKGRRSNRADNWETFKVFQVRGDGGFDQVSESENEKIIVKEELIGFTD